MIIKQVTSYDLYERKFIPCSPYSRGLIDWDSFLYYQLKQALICTQQDKQGPLALIHYADNAIGIEEDLL
ncbi:hypothetical protein MEG1DRAFT_03718 [Photorhabdus temperata subsp. temperata Meg1]|uniref:Uncharacterized protein n=1 Tax=Photorhabdus temperata subsp. temperata Meg1 TaxID=1393735 RepID=A0A081RSL9_PHOTE|nr:pdl (lipase family) protein [Photorhabdus temperata subsp. temperata M1021]KER01672.1 hypothetical protein MEG1DRAFT_03718 [Photorhabdus temperata subsp. temperata Meg1]